jgi:hypothetical protein
LKTLFDYAWVTQKGTASYDFYYLGKPTNERRRFQALKLKSVLNVNSKIRMIINNHINNYNDITKNIGKINNSNKLDDSDDSDNSDDSNDSDDLENVKNKFDKINVCDNQPEQHDKNIFLNPEFIENLINILTIEFIPAGTKGIIRGNIFNSEIKNIILLNFQNKYKCYFEKHMPIILPEKPDWFITDSNKYLVGYNQLDLWSGGHQSNRGSKYIMDDLIHNKYKVNNIKIVSVVCSYIKIDNNKNKKYELFNKGISENRLLYPNHLIDCINNYFIN